MKKIFLILVVLIAVVLLLAWKSGAPKVIKIQEKQKEGGQLQQKIIYKNASNDMIKIELPFAGAVVGKEFSVLGEARGYWFFEASFPIEVLGSKGERLATGIAQAGPDRITGEINWMTTNFVPFRADIKVPENYTGRATLILHKDNPSGLSENDASVAMPIIIAE
ncbi:MAG: Gmad2 immunoglobulin-like domain-containing protein [Patescibacteria group bacterium]